MTNNEQLNKYTCRTKDSERQAIRESLAPFAPFPDARAKSND